MIDPRWRTVLTVTPYIVLGMLGILTLVVQWGDAARVVSVLLLSAADAAWIATYRRLPRRLRERGAVVGTFMTGLIAVNLALVLLDSWYGFLTIATFTFAYSIVPWPGELLAVGATAAVAGMAQGSSLDRDPAGLAALLGIIALNVVAMCGLSWSLRLAERQLQRAARQDERARLARDIHDTLAQGFAGIVTQLQAAADAPDDAARSRHTDAALALARDGLAEARRSVTALRPAALEAARLPEALGNLAVAWSERTGVPVEVALSADAADLGLDAEVALLRTAQEALANIERHAGATHVALTLRSEPSGATRLEVRDDGCGFDPARPVTRGAGGGGGYGLVAMRERIHSVAGELSVETTPGAGTAVRAEVPA